MPHPVEDLRSAVARFRRARADLYLARLNGSGDPDDPAREADLVAPCHPERVQAYVESSSLLADAEHAALGAHMLRAQVERAVRSVRAEAIGWALHAVEISGQRRALAVHWSDPQMLASPSARDLLLKATEGALDEADVHGVQTIALERAGQAAREGFAALGSGRHPDAGPEGGSGGAARDYLAASAELTREALGQLARERQIELRHAVDLLAALRCTDLADLRREGRGQRTGALWRGLGLRDVLNQHVRLTAPHGSPGPAAQLIVRAPAVALFVSPSPVEAGLVSELALVEASGRALALASVSRALPFELRWPAVGSVARAVGMASSLGLLHGPLWERHYRVGRPAARQLARATAALALCRTRLAAAASLAQGQGPEALAALASEALCTSVPPGLASALLLRQSPGGDARAALYAPALALSLRERFDEDWLRNPRAAEPLLGACLRGGDTSVEAFARDLGANHEAGLSLLAELF